MTHSSINRIDVGTTWFYLKWACQGRMLCPIRHFFPVSLNFGAPCFPLPCSYVCPPHHFPAVSFPSVQFYVYSPSSHVPASILTVTFHGILSLLSQTSQILRMLFPPTSSIYHSPTYRETCALWESVGQEKAWGQVFQSCKHPSLRPFRFLLTSRVPHNWGRGFVVISQSSWQC